MASDLTVAEIDTAIRSVLQNGQYIADNGSIYRKADLDSLRAMRKEALSTEMSTGGSFFNRQKVIIPYRG